MKLFSVFAVMLSCLSATQTEAQLADKFAKMTFINSQPAVKVVFPSGDVRGFVFSTGDTPSHIRFGAVGGILGHPIRCAVAGEWLGGACPLPAGSTGTNYCSAAAPQRDVCLKGSHAAPVVSASLPVCSFSSATPQEWSASTSGIRIGFGSDVCQRSGVVNMNLATVAPATSGFTTNGTALYEGVIVNGPHYKYKPKTHFAELSGLTKRLECSFAPGSNGYAPVPGGVWQQIGAGTGSGFRCGKVNEDSTKVVPCTTANYPGAPAGVAGVYVACGSSSTGSSAICGSGAVDQCHFPSASFPNGGFKAPVRCQGGFTSLAGNGTDVCVSWTQGTVTLVD